MKVLLTGTHFTPAQAIIEELQRYPQIELIYIGRNHTMEGDKTPSIESEIIPQLGVKFIPIHAGRLQRQFTCYTPLALLKIPLGFFESFFYLLKEKPDLVVSFGGYTGLPVVVSAWLLSIPVIIHEQALIPGLANTVSALFADKIAVSFDKKYSAYPRNKMVVTGNPLRRPDLSNTAVIEPKIREFIKRSQKDRLPLIVITGGNQGAHSINEFIRKNLKELTKNYFIFHQTGKSKYADFEVLSRSRGEIKYPDHYLPLEWIGAASLSKLFEDADLIISRAGINTLLEALRFKKPLLTIPLPVKEQRYNGAYFEQLGVARVLDQKSLNLENFLKKLGEMVRAEKFCADLDTDSLIIPDATQRLSQEILIQLERGE